MIYVAGQGFTKVFRHCGHRHRSVEAALRCKPKWPYIWAMARLPMRAGDAPFETYFNLGSGAFTIRPTKAEADRIRAKIYDDLSRRDLSTGRLVRTKAASPTRTATKPTSRRRPS